MIQLMKGRDKPLDKLKWPMWLETKFDGVRLAVIVDGPDIVIRTYNGKTLRSDDLVDLFYGMEDGVYDGELVYASGSSDTRTTVSGAVNSAIHGGCLKMDGYKVILFDYLTLDEYRTAKCATRYGQRRAKLRPTHPWIEVSSPMLVSSAQEALDLFDHLTSVGMEGIMLKVPDHLYEFKRSSNWIKKKLVATMDLTCIGWTEGTGKYEGMIGALICQLGDIEVKVGSGLTDFNRAQDPDYYVGKTIEVKYNSIIENQLKPGLKSLYLPRFVCVRFDK